ncbi:MAG: hypothetical protein QOF78_4551 [Phycisphaerales bacterium]|jgi:hypothetical protein|nr:hypothetical protein [Phycisphaerales bacterium]
MPPRKKASSRSASSTSKKKKPPKAKRASKARPATAVKAAQSKFVTGLVARGEAVRTDGGPLPPGATHEIVQQTPGQLPLVKRRRFSAF